MRVCGRAGGWVRSSLHSVFFVCCAIVGYGFIKSVSLVCARPSGLSSLLIVLIGNHVV